MPHRGLGRSVSHSHTLMILPLPARGEKGATETSFHQPSSLFPGKWKKYLGNGPRSKRWMGWVDYADDGCDRRHHRVHDHADDATHLRAPRPFRPRDSPHVTSRDLHGVLAARRSVALHRCERRIPSSCPLGLSYPAICTFHLAYLPPRAPPAQSRDWTIDLPLPKTWPGWYDL